MKGSPLFSATVKTIDSSSDSVHPPRVQRKYLRAISSKCGENEYAFERLVRWTTFKPLWTTATVMVGPGEIVEETLPAVEKLGADLIVMGSNPDRAFG